MICRTAKTAPQQLRLPFTTWSLATLADYLGRYYRLTISVEAVRTILRDAEITWQATKTWKHHNLETQSRPRLRRQEDPLPRPP